MNRKQNVLATRLFVVVVLLMTLVPSAFAQYAETTGVIQGTVRDPSGAVIPSASLVLSSTVIASRKGVTDDAGYYRFVNLPPGEYSLLASATGFKQEKRTLIRLEVGRTLIFDFKLEVGQISAVIEVESAPLNIDITSNKAAVNVTADEIQNLPKGRNAFTLIDLAPGARFEPLQGAVRGSTTTRGVDFSFQIDGASDGENVYAIEGMDTTNVRQGGIGVAIPQDFVQEVQIKSSGFEAEYGGALGGVVNLVMKRGTNAWHGSGVLYLRASETDAAPRPIQRRDPTVPLQGSPAQRLSNPVQYYQPKKDRYKILDPGFDAGGPIWTDRLWIYASYLPSFIRQTRTVNFNCTTACKNPFAGPRSSPSTDTIHFARARLDGQVIKSVRASFAWDYAYRRREGQSIPSADSVFPSQFNGSSTTDPGSFRPDFGDVNPNSTYTASADWTISPKWIVTGRFGYWFTNSENRGRPTGTRFVYNTASGTTGLGGAPVPAASQGPAGFQNMPSNFQTRFDSFKRHGLNLDSSYLFRAWGTHTFKGGYALNRLAEDVQETFVTSLVFADWGLSYTPTTSGGTTVCGQLNSANGGNGCRGTFGTYTIQDGVETFGKVASYNHALYVQDVWQLARGVTLNLGVRFDKEYLPAYAPAGSPAAGAKPINFGFTDKVAPRIGGAWDVFGKGKLKVYASWGLFYDIMKYEMPRGAFGGEYWHNCIFSLDNADLSLINPVLDSNGHSCPGAGGTTGTKIEEVDFRVQSVSAITNTIDPDIKPMRQREFVVGGEYSLARHIGLEVRYARKRLDRTIEDMAFFDNSEEYFIGNPGEGILRRNYYVSTIAAGCSTCPDIPKAKRNYDGIEFKVRKTWSQLRFLSWWAEGSYTYSRLWGNYSGLTSTDEEGRHSPNVNRFFDLPHMPFDHNGKPVFGLLNTDRPHTFKLFTAAKLKWWGMESTIGISQAAFSGTPIGTEIGLISTGSSSEFVEGRGNFVNITRSTAVRVVPNTSPAFPACQANPTPCPASVTVTGDWVSNGIRRGFRTEPFTNTDLLFVHEFRVSKTNEALRMAFEINATNLLNQHHVLNIANRVPRSGVITFNFVPGSAGTTGTVPDWASVFAGYDYIAKANEVIFSPTTGLVTRNPLVLDSLYGLPSRFQSPRTVRWKVKFSF